jgi:predicted nicotinamide N-methyase
MGRTTKSGDSSKQKQPQDSKSAANRPRNHLITDATTPFDFLFCRYGVTTTITVHQTPEEETWPGGSLWDCGVLLAQVLVLLTRGTTLADNNNKSTAAPTRLLQAIPHISWKDMRVMELGCGVGLTGLVAAALGAKVTLLTDLQVVVDKVAKKNVECNTWAGPSKVCGYRTTRTGGRVAAMPLCWGDEHDEEEIKAALERVTPKQTSTTRAGIPDLILIGDVAYQQRPGAPSHFEALLSTLLKFMDKQTIVLFGTRMRMPASSDLLDLFRQHMVELVAPPLEAHELNASLCENELNRKHNTTIHMLKLKRDSGEVVAADESVP